MKKLTNVSPFLLLLFPVLVMMIFAFATSNTNHQDDEVALKAASSTPNMVKAKLQF